MEPNCTHSPLKLAGLGSTKVGLQRVWPCLVWPGLVWSGRENGCGGGGGAFFVLVCLSVCQSLNPVYLKLLLLLYCI